MNTKNYEQLYKLQDQVLKTVFDTENEFYLTGGTCLSRFYNEKRYSDDLDFFTNNSKRYNFAVKNIKQALLQDGFKVKSFVEAKDFTRFLINDQLQVDFVNDSTFHYKDIVLTDKKYLVDNIENILANKISAVLGRDNPKDIFDIYLISKTRIIDWKVILDAAHEKAVFTDEELIVRLKSFPLELMSKINIIDKSFLDNFDTDFADIIKNITT